MALGGDGAFQTEGTAGAQAPGRSRLTWCSGREGGERQEDASLADITEPGEALLTRAFLLDCPHLTQEATNRRQ